MEQAPPLLSVKPPSKCKTISILLLIIGLSFTARYVILNRYALPPGNDPPMYIIIGRTFLHGTPLVAGYPPLVPLIFCFLGVPITRIYGPLILSLFGVASYFFIKEITKNEFIAIIGCAIGATGSMFYFFEASLAWGNNAMLTSFVLSMILYWVFVKFDKGEANFYHLVIGSIVSFLLGLTHILAFIFYFVIAFNLILKSLKDIKFVLKGLCVFVLPGASSLPFIVNSAIETVANPPIPKGVLSGWADFNPAYSLLDIVFDFTMVFIALLGTLIVYKFYRNGFGILACSFIFPIPLAFLLQILHFPTFYSRILGFSLPPLLIFAAVCIGHFSALLLEKGMKKPIAVFLVILSISVIWTMMIYRLPLRVENDALNKVDEYDAIQWLTANISADSKIAATFPLAAWIEVITTRKVISGYHLLEAITTRELLEKYRDVEIIQIANYYRELGFFKVYDMSPLGWTLSPLICVYSYDQAKFIPFFWIDDGLSSVNGQPLGGSFTTWQLNTRAYTVEGKLTTKQLIVNAKSVSLFYSFTNLSRFQLTILLDSQIAQTLDEVYIMGQKIVIERFVPIAIDFNGGATVSKYKDTTWNLIGIEVVYESTQDVRIEVYTTTIEPIPDNDYTALRDELLTMYSIDYIVVYKHDSKAGWALSMLRRAHMIVYENEAVAVFKVESGT